MIAISCPSMFQILAVLSSPALARYSPSGLKLTLFTQSVCPSKVIIWSPVTASQTTITGGTSLLLAKSVPSGL